MPLSASKILFVANIVLQSSSILLWPKNQGQGLPTFEARSSASLLSSGRFFEPVEEALRDARKTGLGTGEGRGEDGTRLVLPAAIDSMENGRFEIVVKAGGEVVGGRKLVVNGARHAVNDGHFPRRLYVDFWICCCLGHIGGRKQCVR